MTLCAVAARNRYAPAIASIAWPNNDSRLDPSENAATVASASTGESVCNEAAAGRSLLSIFSSAATRCFSATSSCSSRSTAPARSSIIVAAPLGNAAANLAQSPDGATGICTEPLAGHGGNIFTSTARINSGKIIRPIETSNPSRVASAIL